MRLGAPANTEEGESACLETTNGTRVIALVGPAGAGKTSLAEAMLFASRNHRPPRHNSQRIEHRRQQRGSPIARRIDRNSTSTISTISATNTPSSTAPARSASPPMPRAASPSPTSRSSSSIPTRPALPSPRRRCGCSTNWASRTSFSSTASTRRTAASATCCPRCSR